MPLTDEQLDAIRAVADRVEVVGDAVLLQGDCRDVLPVLPKVDAVVTDPPYGIGESGGAQRTRSRRGYAKHEKLSDWDSQRPEDGIFAGMLEAAESQIIWGGNYFADILPASKGWLYWKKLMGGDFADGELAWTSLDRALREYTQCPKGMDKAHPCEKPEGLMRWCLSFLPDSQTILDPFMGSGTTGVAAVQMGRDFIGIEREEKYFDIACRRIEEAQKQGDMFVEQPKPKAEQTGLDLGDAA